MLQLRKRLRIELSFLAPSNITHAAAILLMICGLAQPSSQPSQIRLENSRVPNNEELLKRYGIGLDTEDLIAALSNKMSEVRGLAANQLARDKDKDAIPFIRNALSIETNRANRIHMALNLAQLGDEKAVGWLERTCSDERAPAYVRVLAAQDLLQLEDKKCLPNLLSIMQGGAQDSDRQAALALLPNYYFGSSQSVPEQVLTAVCSRLTDDSPMVRVEASIVLEKIGTGRQAGALENAISKEPEDAVRQQMEQVLDTLKRRAPK